MTKTMTALAIVAIMGGGVAKAQFGGTWSATGLSLEVARGGETFVRPLPVASDSPQTFTLGMWLKPKDEDALRSPIVRIDGQTGNPISIGLEAGRLVASQGGAKVAGAAKLSAARWTYIAIVSGATGTILYIDGRPSGRAKLILSPKKGGSMTIAPLGSGVRFAGQIVDAAFSWGERTALEIAATYRRTPAFDLARFNTNSPTWPMQRKQQLGQEVPQPAETLPRSNAPVSAPVAKPVPSMPALSGAPDGRLEVNGWRLTTADDTPEGGAAISTPGYDVRKWHVATVPGTILTTLVDRGVYPNPAYGLNNMAIPEELARQSYWYRTEFRIPQGEAASASALIFKGINYAAEVWVNGRRLGDIKGAFVRGRFDVSSVAAPGSIVAVAVKMLPPPHPGVAHEESLTAGAGENGGMLVLDGPTFVASEGWDWIPSIRDRNMGLWQPVLLERTGAARIGDTQVITSLPHPDNSVAEVEILVPVENLTDQQVRSEVTASFDDVSVSRPVDLPPRSRAVVTFKPNEFPKLSVRNPRLWWPNGYGKPELHELRVQATVDGRTSDTRSTRFGIRQVTYDISLMGQDEDLHRVRIDLTKARQLGQQIVDGTHEGIRKVRGGWAASLAPGALQSAAVTPVKGEEGLAPHLVLRVNGVRIAARGGNIGMDDFMKRVERQRLEPFFRLHRDAHLNIIRNWVGQNTEDVFFDLADEYGLMVLNDFWESTQDYNQQIADMPLFLANAKDVVSRYSIHPSIVAWIGRNEGVPEPVLNASLEKLVSVGDGTRLYMGSSNNVNLAGSGPYDWKEPSTYFTEHAKGFAVELGTPSFPTLESWKRAIPEPDLWPISDAWAYHDWHQDRGGSVKTYMEALRLRFGEPSGLEDFANKAQLLQYDSHRAIFEGFNANLWKTTSARMLWMTQPAWPSSAWNIFSSDYDTQASYYAVKKAAEPIHVQMNLPDHRVVIVNNTLAARPLRVRTRIADLSGKVFSDVTTKVTAAGEGVTDVLDIAPNLLSGTPVAFVSLEALDAGGSVVSRNFYWEGRQPSDLQALNGMPKVRIDAIGNSRVAGGETTVTLQLRNGAASPAIEAKATLFDSAGKQILPAYFDDNYLSLLPGEKREIKIAYPTSNAQGPVSVRLTGWNVQSSTVEVR